MTDKLRQALGEYTDIDDLTTMLNILANIIQTISPTAAHEMRRAALVILTLYDDMMEIKNETEERAD